MGDSEGKVTAYITHFDMLLVKKDGLWLALMGHQKSDATLEEWDALK